MYLATKKFLNTTENQFYFQSMNKLNKLNIEFIAAYLNSNCVKFKTL